MILQTTHTQANSSTIVPSAWDAQPAALELAVGEVHLWRALLTQPAQWPDNPGLVLAPEEKQRAQRMQPGRARQRFVAGRRLLRTALAGYLACAPSEVRFVYGAQGKPNLSPEYSRELQFNLAHSHDMILLAVGRGRPVGVDVEWIRPLPALQRMAGRIMSSEELRRWQALPCEAQLEAFFSLWTRQEALAKGMGVGVAAVWGRDTRHAGGCQNWWSVALEPAPGYAGALALAGGEPPALNWRQFPLQPSMGGPWSEGVA